MKLWETGEPVRAKAKGRVRDQPGLGNV